MSNITNTVDSNHISANLVWSVERVPNSLKTSPTFCELLSSKKLCKKFFSIWPSGKFGKSHTWSFDFVLSQWCTCLKRSRCMSVNRQTQCSPPVFRSLGTLGNTRSERGPWGVFCTLRICVCKYRSLYVQTNKIKPKMCYYTTNTTSLYEQRMKSKTSLYMMNMSQSLFCCSAGLPSGCDILRIKGCLLFPKNK